MGLLIAANAGYNPGAAIGLWKRMKQNEIQPPEWLSTHPYPETRITNLQNWMPEAMKLYKQTISSCFWIQPSLFSLNSIKPLILKIIIFSSFEVTYSLIELFLIKNAKP